MWIPFIFIVGYLLIIFEHKLHINKAAAALVVGIISWGFFLNGDGSLQPKVEELSRHIADISQVVFYLIGAMTIVELINTHRGFDSFGALFTGKSQRVIYWGILFVSFFLSAVLDNLTTIIVMVSMLRPLIQSTEKRQLMCAGLVIAVNAGGAWTPIGDVTTTMLWIEGAVTSLHIMQKLFIPSVAALLVFGFFHKRSVGHLTLSSSAEKVEKPAGSLLISALGISCLIMVPVLKAVFHIPPYLGILLGVGIMWLATDLFHGKKEEREHFKMQHALTKIDMSCVFFFFGILLMVDALEAIGLLERLAVTIGNYVPTVDYLAVSVGLVSAVVDNVPLVAACIKMYKYAFPVDHSFWTLTAFAAGTGGSILIIGSAPGVALMTMEDVSFGWYLRNIAWIAFLSYCVGILLCILM